jgi:cytochrome o ubiquinol oxidase operon protein cyoD
MVVQHILKGGILIAFVMACAIAQLLVQIIFFLHLKSESRPRFNLVVLAFTFIVIVLVVGGSLWIMENLNTHMTSADVLDELIPLQNQHGGF